MDKLNKIKLVKMLKTLPFPVVRYLFKEPQNAPYLIYRDDDFNDTAANSKKINRQTCIIIELYTEPKQTEQCEEITETLLDDFTTYEKARSFIESEGVAITYYKFNY